MPIRAAVNRIFLSLFAAGFAVLVSATARAAPVRTENVEAELVSARAVAAPGERFTVALRQTIRAGWHTYWRNPGDSGEPTELTWSDAQGFKPGPLQWPAPEAIRVGPLVNYGYAGQVAFPIEITVPAHAPPGRVELKAHARWLVCADICIPEEADLVLPLQIGAVSQDDPVWKPLINQAVAQLPAPAGEPARLVRSGDAYELSLAGGPFARGGVRNAYFFPYAGDAIDHAAKQDAKFGPEGLRLRLTPSVAGGLGGTGLAGVLTFEAKQDGGWARKAVEITAAAGAPPAAGRGDLGLGLAIVFAFLGGIILNAMPCVFPVLSIKALSLARGADEKEARGHGLLFLAGVMATFLALAGTLLALKAGGAAVGWGFQLQEPLVVGGLALLFFAIGLNLIGAYELGGGVQNVGQGLAARGGGSGAFFTGALAVVAATPCTAPFMGGALGYAATQPAAASLGVFAALGLGFAAPFTFLSMVPALRGWIPKPGPWMARFKEMLAFPMFAAAVWLVWVLAQQAGAPGVLAVLTGFLGLAFIIWCWRAFRSAAPRWAGAAAAALLLGAAGWSLRAAPAAASKQSHVLPLSGEAWSPAREAALRAEGRLVFVNFTAAWCVTCQVNERVAFSADAVVSAFAARKVAYLEADWTARDPIIAAALAAHGRAGVPLYLLYPAGGGAPRILPQILTPGIVLDALQKAGGARTGG